MRGATRCKREDRCIYKISIHAPRAGCDAIGIQAARIEAISIHAPRAGCDTAPGFRRGGNARFQSTHPVRGATKRAKTNLVNAQFQSTHPVRGATTHKQVCFVIPIISIHAPRAGCDLKIPLWSWMRVRFQSTHPVRGATILAHILATDHSNFNPRTPCGVRQRGRAAREPPHRFQSTHPVRGATGRLPQFSF